MSFEGFPLEAAIADRARTAGVLLDADAVAALAFHARAVLAASSHLHLTAIVDPAEFVERHVGESLDGAARIAPGTIGPLIDLGSGNGYPGVPIAVSRPTLRPTLVEASEKKAAFLREITQRLGWPATAIAQRAVNGARDLVDLAPISVLATRAMGGWERLLPKLARLMAPDGVLLLWAGVEAEVIVRRTAWNRYALRKRTGIPGRDKSWIWEFAVKAPDSPTEHQ